MFREFDEKMRLLCAKEINVNLTDLKSIPKELIDKEMSQKYGVKVIDLSDRKYCLLEHVKSRHESVDDLVNGRANGEQVFISLSLGSHRNQKLTTDGFSTIFWCSSFDSNLLIRSSIENLFSNDYINKYSYEVDTDNMAFTQRGALETSSAINERNSEV